MPLAGRQRHAHKYTVTFGTGEDDVAHGITDLPRAWAATWHEVEIMQESLIRAIQADDLHYIRDTPNAPVA